MKKIILSVLLLLVLSSHAFAQSAPISNNYSRAQIDKFFATYTYVDSVSVHLQSLITALSNSLGTAATKNTGTSVGNVVVVESNGKVNPSVLPDNSAVTSVNGQTGAVTLNKTDIGLGNVANSPQMTTSHPANQITGYGTGSATTVTRTDDSRFSTYNAYATNKADTDSVYTKTAANNLFATIANLALKASIAYVNGTDETILSALNAAVTKLNNVERIAAQISTSCLISGGIISQVDDTHFQVGAGYGYIVDAYSDPQNPTYQFVSWGTFENILSPYLNTANTTYICYEEDGQLHFYDQVFSPEERRKDIDIGWVDHADRTKINNFKTQPYPGRAVAAQLTDFLLSFGSFNITGNDYFPLSGLTIFRSAGKTFDTSANWEVDQSSPHIVTTEIESPATLWYSVRDGSGGWDNGLPTVSAIDPNHWDNGTGTLQDVPLGKFTIQPITYYSQSLSNDLQYGQVVFDTLADAQAHIRDVVELNPYNAEWDTFRGWIIVKQGATDLTATTQAVFISAGKLGLSDVQSGSGYSGGEANTASNYGTRGQGVYDSKSGVDLKFKNLYSCDPFMTITENITSHTLDFDITTGTTSTTLCIGNDPRLPSQSLLDAFIGTSGTPSSSNKFVTNSDPRNTDTRIAKAHASSHLDNGTDPITITSGMIPSGLITDDKINSTIIPLKADKTYVDYNFSTTGQVALKASQTEMDSAEAGIAREHNTNASQDVALNSQSIKLSGIADNATKVEASTTNGNIKINGSETTVYTAPTPIQTGHATFNSTTGATIPITALPNANYTVVAFLIGNSGGRVGDIWIDSQTQNNFVVKCSGSSTTSQFGWLLIPITDVRFVQGSASFNGSTGATIPIGQDMGTSNYRVMISPSENGQGRIGDFWAEQQTNTNFVVKCSGTSVTAFRWMIML